MENYFSFFFPPHLFVLATALDTIYPRADGKHKPHALKSPVSLLLEVGLVGWPQLCGNLRPSFETSASAASTFAKI